MKANSVGLVGWLRRLRQPTLARLVLGLFLATLLLGPIEASSFGGYWPGLQNPNPLIDPPDLN
jgi:hypothetical protein